MAEISSAVRSDLIPGGKLRVGINFGNALLTKRDPAPGGIAVDLARELAQRLGVPLEIITHESAGSLAESASTGAWEVGFLGAEPQRANEISFTAPYLEIDSTYLVPAGSPLRTIADVDREGIRIAVSAKSAYDLHLSRTLKDATLVRAHGGPAAFKLFVSDMLDALAGLKPILVKDNEKLPGSRLLEGRFSVVQQAVGTPKGRDAGAKYLREFVEDVKATGLVARVIEKNGIRGVSVAPKASIQ
ncbi:MAG: ABC transporter substrate-binding protein [Betaproteobacteria bacterium]|nr:ABC transporter substrate-binding protein [Betaproteobacteria bacterium]